MKYRTKIIPIAVWSVLALLALVLFLGEHRHAGIVAIAEGVEIPIAPSRDARVQTIHVEPGQTVQPGDLLATMDSTLLEAELEVARAEFIAAQAEVLAGANQTQARQLSWDRDVAESADSSSLALTQARAELNIKRAEHRTVSQQLKEMQGLLAKQLVTKKDLLELEVKYAALEQEIAAAEKGVALLEGQSSAARKRVGSLPQNYAALSDDVTATHKQLIQERIEQLEAERAAMVLRAPAAGQVIAVHLQAGSFATAGIPVVTMVETSTSRVLACIPEHYHVELKAGDGAILHPRDDGNEVKAKVVSAGTRVGQLPMRCQSHPNMPRFGREVWLAAAEKTLAPGAAFSVEFDGSSGGGGGGNQAEASAKPKAPLQVPKKLAQKTRFEASGICWSGARGRYLVVSDDTGGGDSEGQPWIFSADGAGNVAEAPLVIGGLEEVSDLESCAIGAGKTLYLLASQSMSKKGKRPDKRQRFLEVEEDGKSLRVTRQVLFAELLEGLSGGQRAALGLSSIDDLDIEGMAYLDGALLLGLKSPTDAQGNAIIWRIAQPARLFAENSLKNAGLTRWATVAAPLLTGGGSVAGGISELLVTPAGGLIIASTPSKTEDEIGALYHVAKPVPPLLQAQQFASFPGKKPEGLSLAPEPGRFVVVFDAGKDAPFWESLPLP